MEQKNDAPGVQAERRELISWKEIAHYLGGNVRTAQKWERERHLPVTRLSGARGRVSAVVAMLDTWKRDSTRISNQADRCYRWPLADNVLVEMRFLGDRLTSAHIELLREYLNLTKTAI